MMPFFSFFFFYSTLCSLHTNLLVANLQGCKLASHQPRTSVTIPFFLRLLSLMVLRLYHLLHPLPAAVSNSSPVTQCQPLQASCCTVLLYLSRSCTARSKILLICCACWLYYVCDMYHKLITSQYYIVNCVS